MHYPTGNSLVRRSPVLSSTPADMHSPTGNLLNKRSPRLSSTPADIDGSSISDAWALSLRVTGNGNGFMDEEPVPLKILDPSLLSDQNSVSEPKSTRRSPRFTTNKYRSVTVSPRSQKAKALPANCLRRSPRFSPVVTETVRAKSDSTLDGVAIEWPVSRGKPKRRRCEDKSESTEAAVSKSSKKVRTCLGKCNGGVLVNLDETCLRRSRRLTSASGSFDNGNVKCEFLALPEPPSMEKPKIDLTMSEKTLRSRKIELRVLKKEDIEVKTALIETPLENGTSLGTCDSSLLSGKCLRSRKIPITIDGNGKVEDKSGMIESPVVGCSKARGKRSKGCALSEKKERMQKVTSCFIGDPVPEDEAQERWRWRYELKSKRSSRQSWILNANEEDEVHLNVEFHYLQAKVDGCIFNLGDCANIKGEGKEKHIGKILEFFKTTEGEDYFRVQWFFRAEDTVMKEAAAFHDKKRLFYSNLMNDNLLDCIISKVNVFEISPALGLQSYSIQPSEFYYDMEYSVEYSTFCTLPAAQANMAANCDIPSCNDVDAYGMANTTTTLEFSGCESYKDELALLDLYSGCGGMSTGLCLGAKLSGVNLVTRWAIDYHKSACDSLKLNHPETQVRHTTAEDFLELLKEWEKLCKSYVSIDSEGMHQSRSDGEGESRSSAISPTDVKKVSVEFEVSSLVDICYGDPSESGKHGLKFKVRWEGYGPSEDTWELIEDLSNCQGHIQDFVRSGLESKILPLPGDVDVICGGPPCQGISGYNRFRNVDAPLTDERNQQIVVFMDIVKFLNPKYVLMENVTDILRFDKASLGRYALSRLVNMNYQARLGIMAAGCYGLPQFRLRVFLWGALPGEKLPQFPLPTHDVVVRYWPPPEFERNIVAYNEGQPRDLEDAVVLRDAISDLPAVTSHETREQMTYERPPETNFQKYIRLTKEEMIGFASNGVIDWKSSLLYDHRPYQLSEDDYIRVCQIPHRKGANFRDLPGIIVNTENVVKRDPTKEPVILPSGKPLVPDYVFTFEKGKSKRPFARIWWDETVGTVVTFPCLHNQAALHPEQDRVLTLREYARLQGFPDYYRFCGTVKERYCQVGNAVAVPVARALGYALGMAYRKLSEDEPVMTLPPKFTSQRTPIDRMLCDK